MKKLFFCKGILRKDRRMGKDDKVLEKYSMLEKVFVKKLSRNNANKDAGE